MFLNQILTLIIFFFGQVSGRSQVTCDNRHERNDIIVCNAPVNSAVCLVCPVSRNTNGASWKRLNKTTIFEGSKGNEGAMGAANVNNCGNEYRNYSFAICIMDQSDEDLFSCTLGEHILAQFHVIVEESTKPEIDSCSQRNDVTEPTTCPTVLNSVVCLICPTSKTTGSSWQSADNSYLYWGDVRGSGLANSYITVNNCNNDNYSLALCVTSFEENEVYICNTGEGESLTFEISPQVLPLLKLSQETGDGITEINSFENNDERISCSIQLAIPPVTVQWLVNDHKHKTDVLGTSSNPKEMTELSSEFIFTSSVEYKTITCLVTGSHIVDSSVSVNIYVTPAFDDVTLFLRNTSQSYIKIIQTEEGKTEYLECVIQGVTPPFSLTWLINGIITKRDSFIDSGTTLDEFVSTFVFISRSNFEWVTCLCSGPFVTNRTAIARISVAFVNDKKLEIVGNESRRPIKQLQVVQGSIIKLRCVMTAVKPPVTLIWSLNGIKQKRQTYEGSTTGVSNLSSSFMFSSLISHEVVSCTAVGPNITETTVIVTLEVYAKQGVEAGPADFNVILSTVLSMLFIIVLVAVIATVLVRRRRMRNNRNRKSQYPLPSVPDELGNKDSPVVYETPENPEDVVYFYGDNVVYHRSDVLLMSPLPSSGRMRRWTAVLRNVADERPSFIASTLSDGSSRDDWCEYRLFAEYLRNIPSHKNIISVVGCDTNKVPHYIYTENITSGTLLEHLIQYRTEAAYSKNIYNEREAGSRKNPLHKQLQEYCTQVVLAMLFLETIDCDHPAVCAKKVLMNTNSQCKLYDFNPCSSTKKVITLLGKQGSSRLQWLAPETILYKRYNRSSDVWSLGIFMWEVFSLGTTPLKDFDPKGIASHGNYIAGLQRPDLCPEDVYALMKTCFAVNAEQRPNLTLVRDALK